MNKREMEKLHKNLNRHLFIQELCTNLHEISYYEARLHKLKFSGSHNYRDIEKALGNLWIDENFDSENENQYYETKASIKCSDFYLVIFVNPKKDIPNCSIAVYPQKDILVHTYKDFLKDLNLKLPGLKVSLIEYTIDLFCNDYKEASSLFWFIRRCLYIPHQRTVQTFDNTKKDKNRNVIQMNSVYKIGRNYTVYERGPDSKKEDAGKAKNKGWRIENVDRVRMEYKAKRTVLKKKGINLLPDLLENPRFMHMNKDWWKLRQFKRTKQLPRMWQDYSEQDKYGFAGTFQLEHMRAKDKVDNVAQYRKNIPEISFFEKKLDKVMLLFDDMWDGRAHTL